MRGFDSLTVHKAATQRSWLVEGRASRRTDPSHHNFRLRTPADVLAGGAMGKRVSLTPELIWDPLFCNVSSFDQRVGIATPHGRESPAFRGSAGSHFSSIAVPLKLRGEQPKGYHPCHIEMSSLSSMTTPQCCGVWHDCCGSSATPACFFHRRKLSQTTAISKKRSASFSTSTWVTLQASNCGSVSRRLAVQCRSST